MGHKAVVLSDGLFLGCLATDDGEVGRRGGKPFYADGAKNHRRLAAIAIQYRAPTVLGVADVLSFLQFH